MNAAAAVQLRSDIDSLLERFRGDITLFEGASALAEEMRLALEEEFIELISQFSKEIFQKAVLMTYDDSKRLPIHLACDKNAPISIMKSFLEADVNKRSIRVPDKWGDLPLHTACSRHQTDVVKLLVDSDETKETIHVKAENGSLPLHTAVRYKAPSSVVKLLLENNESTLLDQGFYNQLPLHVACRNSAAPDVIHLLLQHDESKVTVMHEDNIGRLPIHVALLHSSENQLLILKLLMEGMLCGRMERRGLYLWKTDLTNLIKSMRTDERDFITRQKLNIICDVIRSFMERLFVLDLAVWRASCLQFSTKYHSMQDIIEFLSSSSNVFDVHAYKVSCHIQSGVDVILREVTPYLENEPVEEMIRKLQDF